VRTSNPMTGVAATLDGQSLWAGSPGTGERNGLFRSTDGGASWQKVNGAISPLCLRHRDGVLFVCADDAVDGFGLGYSRDGGAHFMPLVSWRQLIGPEGCPADSDGRKLCEADWPRLRRLLAPAIDGGPLDAPAATDAGGAADAVVEGPPAAGGCACGVASRGGGGMWLIFLLFWARRGRRRRTNTTIGRVSANPSHATATHRREEDAHAAPLVLPSLPLLHRAGRGLRRHLG
jgi:hypothetical protein